MKWFFKMGHINNLIYSYHCQKKLDILSKWENVGHTHLTAQDNTSQSLSPLSAPYVSASSSFRPPYPPTSRTVSAMSTKSWACFCVVHASQWPANHLCLPLERDTLGVLFQLILFASQQYVQYHRRSSKQYKKELLSFLSQSHEDKGEEERRAFLGWMVSVQRTEYF